MTPAQLDHLRRIDAHCERKLAKEEYVPHYSASAEAGWKATRAAIADILNCQLCGGTGITDGWRPTYADPDNVRLAKEAEPCCEHAKHILAAFPLEMLETTK